MKIFTEKMDKQNNDKEIYLYTLSNNDTTVKITNYGATILSIMTKDRNGKVDDIVLGYDKFDDYKTREVYLGAVVGRYANRIKEGKFELNGIEYQLAKNNGNNHLHGGPNGFHRVVWDSEIVKDNDGECLKLSYLSKDGEENYPGNLNVTVEYKLTEENELIINYYGKSDKDTILNLTNHSYFNLGGHASGDILNHKVKIYSNSITATDAESIPTGEIRNIIGTPLDFSEFKTVGEDIEKEYDQLNYANGYDHNWIIDNYTGELNKAAEVIDSKSGRMLEVFTTKPGIQFYTGNFLTDEEIGKGGVKYNKRHGLCLETQYFPDSVHHSGFSNVILEAGQEYKHTTIYKMSVINE